jgi:uncharacterized protein with PQ loop repeat
MRTWRVPNVPEEKHIEPPSIWIAVFAFVVVLIAGFIITILNWKQGDSIVSAKFFGFALGLPLLVWGALCGLLYLPSEDWNDRADLWNFLCTDNFNNWRAWSQWNLRILDTVTLTPEVELAERVLGLEGSAPMNKGKVLSLQAEGDVIVDTKLEDVLTQLVTPFVGPLQRFTGKRTVHIALQSTQDAHLAVLRTVLQKLEIAHEHIALSRYTMKDVPGILDEWMENQKVRYDYGYRERKIMPDLCLMLACQFNEDGAPTVSEAAFGLLFGSWQMLEDTKLKVKARLFRSIPTTTDEIAAALKTLQTAEPTPLKRLRNLWVSKLAKRDGHIVRAIAKDSEPALTLIDLDEALGVPGPASPLLLQALAAQTVQFGQGPQLVAMPDAEGLRLNLVGNGYAEIAEAKRPEPEFWPVSYAAVFGSLLPLIEVAIIASDAGAVWTCSVLGVGLLLFLVGIPAGRVFRLRGVSREFYERARG